MEGGWFPKYGSRLSAARIRSHKVQERHGLRITRFQDVGLALAPRTFVVKKMQEIHGLMIT
eukprot:5000397-Pyramimonas_sp.AAC.1